MLIDTFFYPADNDFSSIKYVVKNVNYCIKYVVKNVIYNIKNDFNQGICLPINRTLSGFERVFVLFSVKEKVFGIFPIKNIHCQ